MAEKRLADAAAKAGMSVAQMKNALRGVPAQFTDIAVSLQSGQNPLTVFLQQGGQLKDMFGSAGGAARALGAYVVGLVNPLTLAAAAAALLGVAYYQGSKEQDAFVLALAKTGNQSGVTMSQLKAYAEQLDKGSITQAKAAESLALFVSAGVSGDGMLQQYTQTAIAWEKATGEGVNVVAQKFAALQGDPLKAALKLNGSMNFLTQSTYDQIAALEEQGQKTQAAEVAMNALDAAMAERTKNINANLGTIEKTWNAITGAAKQAWDAMLNVGRAKSLDERLVAAQEALRKMEEQGAGLFERGTYKQQLAAQRELVSSLEQQSATEAINAAAAKTQKEQVQARVAWDALVNKNLTDREKLEKGLAEIRQKGLADGRSEIEIQKLENKLRDDFNKKQPKAPKTRTPNAFAGETELANIMSRVQATNQLIEALRSEGQVTWQNTEGGRLAYKLQQEIDSGKLKGIQLVQKERQLAAAKELQTAQEALKAEERSRTAAIDRANTQFQLQEQLIASRQKYNAQLSTYGMGDTAAQQALTRVSIEEKQQEEIRRMTFENGQEMRKAESEAQRTHLQEMFAERLALTKEAQAQELVQYDSYIELKKSKDQNWALGAQSALATYVETSTNAYANAKDATLSMARTVEGAFTTLFTLGESSAKNFFATILKGIAQIAAQQAASGIAGFLGTAISSLVGGGLSNLGSMGAGVSSSSILNTGAAFGGFRANGGPVDSGSFYRVNERGPELMTVGNRDYLMMGGQSGYVKPVSSGTGGTGSTSGGMGNVTIVNQTTGRIDNVEQRQLTKEDVVLIIQEKTPGVMVSQTQNASSPFSRTMQSSFNTSRRR
ncbi:phage tail length tape measure family protein [Pseudomonas sp.]|uniref:phage tail length tape measure family protein n=1 Tax=Pseudomonas sp. TaxID=306 RepID=UPI002590A563|nr:phage tail length tape measure family protein [Pseudomonas sp.]